MATPPSIQTIEMLMARSWSAVGRAQRRIGDNLADVIVTHGTRMRETAQGPLLPNGKVSLAPVEIVDLLTDCLLLVKGSAERLEAAGDAALAAPMWPLAAEVLAVRTEVAGPMILVCVHHGEYRPLAPPMRCPQC